jgi:DNA-binding NarL/FixJ family response regulator
VLCVDDHELLVDGLRARFAIEGGIEVVGCLASADRLTEEVERLRPDVVLLDIEMPGPDAFEMTDRMSRKHPEVRVIVLSAHIRDAFISASFRAGVRAYFAKSDELDDIVGGIYEVMRSGAGSFLLGPKVRERCRLTPGGGDPAGRWARDSERPARANAPMTPLNSLTPREEEILRLIGKGLSRTQMGSNSAAARRRLMRTRGG